MKKTVLISALGTALALSPLTILAQQPAINLPAQQCGTDEWLKHAIEKDASLKVKRDNLELLTEEFIANLESYKVEGGCTIYVIPTVIHKENTITTYDAATAQSIVDELTLYFRKRNPYITNVVTSIDPAFQSIVADVEVEFKLAQKDQYGQATQGVVNESAFNSWNNGNLTLPLYYEVFVVDNPPMPGASAIATMPGGGYTAPAVTTIYTGATLAHESGHWLNLYHTFGYTNAAGNPNNCFYDDYVSDTPPCVGGTSCYSTQANPINTCHNDTPDLNDNYQNFMDYRTGCQLMFTQGQKNRMVATLQTDPLRSKLWTSQNLSATGVSGLAIYPCDSLTTGQSAIVQKNSTIKVYPNPTVDGSFTITHVDYSDLLRVYNVFGQEVNAAITKQNNEARVQINTPGAYFVFINSRGKITNQKVIVGKE